MLLILVTNVQKEEILRRNTKNQSTFNQIVNQIFSNVL